MNITIRTAIRQDQPFIVQAQLAMALETESLQLPADAVTLGVAAVFNDPSKGSYYVAEIDNQVVGCLLTIPEWSDWRNGTVLWIHSVWITSPSRKQGVFRALYSHLKSIVELDPNLRGLRLYVEKSNVNAQKTYERLGMSNDHYFLYEWLK